MLYCCFYRLYAFYTFFVLLVPTYYCQRVKKGLLPFFLGGFQRCLKVCFCCQEVFAKLATPIWWLFFTSSGCERSGLTFADLKELEDRIQVGSATVDIWQVSGESWLVFVVFWEVWPLLVPLLFNFGCFLGGDLPSFGGEHATLQHAYKTEGPYYQARTRNIHTVCGRSWKLFEGCLTLLPARGTHVWLDAKLGIQAGGQVGQDLLGIQGINCCATVASAI